MSTVGAPLSPFFSALGDPNRLRIVVRLCDAGPCSTSQVTTVVPVSRQAASKHLQLLENAGLVTSSRSGRERIWTVRTEPLARASWPSFDPDVAKAEEVVVPVQINGKVRARLTLPAGLADDELRDR